jgi:hypothetical protein
MYVQGASRRAQHVYLAWKSATGMSEEAPKGDYGDDVNVSSGSKVGV